MATDFTYEMNEDGPDIIIDQNSNSFVALREIRWNPNHDFKTDVRRYFIKEDGVMPGKGISVSHPELLTLGLIQTGYGDMKDMMISMMDRDDFVDGMGQACAEMSDEDYETMIHDVTESRDNHKTDVGMSTEEFMETLK